MKEKGSFQRTITLYMPDRFRDRNSGIFGNLFQNEEKQMEKFIPAFQEYVRFKVVITVYFNTGDIKNKPISIMTEGGNIFFMREENLTSFQEDLWSIFFRDSAGDKGCFYLEMEAENIMKLDCTVNTAIYIRFTK